MAQGIHVLGILLSLFFGQAISLKIATSLQWIEYTPQPYAIKNFYKGTDTATLSSGGVANLATDSSLDLAANAETQGLKQYASHKNLRLIYVIVEVGYRMVANQAAGITKIGDLKGKRIGTMQGTSASYFVNKLLGSANLKSSDYTIVSGSVCMKTPCGSGTFPSMITGKKIDAFGIWEPAVELGAKSLGSSAVIFQNVSIYREVYSLYSTTEKLNNIATRKNIVAYVKALNQTLDVFRNRPESVYATVGGNVGVDASVVQAVWPVHKWSGTIPSDLVDFLVVEDAYLAQSDKRAVTSKADLTKFIDSSVIADAQRI
ncbi:Periplasmic binding protein-like II [Glarea lozoyensis ATCC 20868]|uniref:Periplasmic binding protein-like II n=1 Tax=Glarea lozoyensis (strain ATCC 20868 / MF5171) TaxID=1116229 RepID=S3DV14_GLAL2|nr:Periplasmic binding protein-like II [Glarea lozoyensis ATCC 20868]EPE30238.1 Periplasmic binding protein-like II [Glarea lozoyensis ATCC 20868]